MAALTMTRETRIAKKIKKIAVEEEEEQVVILNMVLACFEGLGSVECKYFYFYARFLNIQFFYIKVHFSQKPFKIQS